MQLASSAQEHFPRSRATFPEGSHRRVNGPTVCPGKFGGFDVMQIPLSPYAAGG